MTPDIFDVVTTAERAFGGLPTVWFALATVGFLVAGFWVIASGLRHSPSSWGLVLAGGGLLAMTYFVAGAAISSGMPELSPPGPTSPARAALICFVAATVPVGFGLYTLRVAARWLASEPVGEKLAGVLFVLAACALLFVAVRIGQAGNRHRTSAVAASAAAQPEADAEADPYAEPDGADPDADAP